MKNQYCKVGASKALTNEASSIIVIEDLYQNFIQKSSDTQYVNTKRGEFFLSKALKFEKMLKNLY